MLRIFFFSSPICGSPGASPFPPPPGAYPRPPTPGFFLRSGTLPSREGGGSAGSPSPPVRKKKPAFYSSSLFFSSWRHTCRQIPELLNWSMISPLTPQREREKRFRLRAHTSNPQSFFPQQFRWPTSMVSKKKPPAKAPVCGFFIWISLELGFFIFRGQWENQKMIFVPNTQLNTWRPSKNIIHRWYPETFQLFVFPRFCDSTKSTVYCCIFVFFTKNYLLATLSYLDLRDDLRGKCVPIPLFEVCGIGPLFDPFISGLGEGLVRCVHWF